MYKTPPSLWAYYVVRLSLRGARVVFVVEPSCASPGAAVSPWLLTSVQQTGPSDARLLEDPLLHALVLILVPDAGKELRVEFPDLGHQVPRSPLLLCARGHG